MATITQWWRHLANAYEVKAGIVCLQCKNYDPYLSTSDVVFHDGELHKFIYLYLYLYKRVSSLHVFLLQISFQLLLLVCCLSVTSTIRNSLRMKASVVLI